MMKTHVLKTWPEAFEAVTAGRKRFEFRQDDGREFRVGDVLALREWRREVITVPSDDTWAIGALSHRGDYTGREVRAEVSYLLRGPDFGVPFGYVVMSLGTIWRRDETDPT